MWENCDPKLVLFDVVVVWRTNEYVKKGKKLQQNRCPSISFAFHFCVCLRNKKNAKRIILQQLISDVSVNRNTPTPARQGSRLNFCPVTDSFARIKVQPRSEDPSSWERGYRITSPYEICLTVCCLANRNWLKMTSTIKRKSLWIEKIKRRVFWSFKAVFFLISLLNPNVLFSRQQRNNRELKANTTTTEARTSSENVTASFCNHFSIIQSYHAWKMCSNCPGIKLEQALGT